MRDSDARRALDELVEILGDLTRPAPPADRGRRRRTRLELARANLAEWAGGNYPGGLDQASISSGRHSNPTENAALAGPVDRWGAKRRDLDYQLVAARDAARRIAQLIAEATAVPPEPGAEGCRLCEQTTAGPGHDCNAACRARHHLHPDRYQPMYARTAPADVDVPDQPRCAFHWRHARNWGEDATDTISRWHLDHPGARVPVWLIRQEHPDAYQTRQRS